jgi:hypothetical protein
MPALIPVILPTGMLISLQDRLQPSSLNKLRSQPPTTSLTTPSLPLTSAGFEGSVAVQGSGQAGDAAGDSLGGGGAARATDSHTSAPEVPSGLNCWFSSLADARLAIQVVLLSKFRMDDAALEAAGGCLAVKAVRLPRARSMQ